MTKKPSNSLDILTETFGHFFEPALLKEIDLVGTWMSATANTQFIDVGDLIPGMPLLIYGSLKIMREDEKGDELLLYYLESGDTCAMTLSCCASKATSSVRAIVEEDAKMVMIPTENMEKWITSYRSWRSYIFDSYDQRMNELLSSIDSLAFKKLDERLWNYLIDKVKITSSTELHITHQEIALELNSSRVVISRLLKQLEIQGKINMHRNSLEVVDF